MKKVGILTFSSSINYGAILQSYALQKTVRDLGFEVEHINYNDYYSKLSELSIVNKTKARIICSAKKILIGNKRAKKTKKFVDNYINYGSKFYSSKKELNDGYTLYDYYITGSDQVWNYQIIGEDSSYFFDFVKNNAPKISYAASFGVNKIPDEKKEFYVKNLKNLTHVSVREKEGKNIIHSLCNREAIIALDPTLLLNNDQWNKIEGIESKKTNYILCYIMPDDKVVVKKIKQVANIISKNTGLKIIYIGQREYYKIYPFEKNIFNAGPVEFLNLFKNADYVVTNSFHGLAFSINFHREFIVPVNRNLSEEKRRNSRILSLVNILNLEDRLLNIESAEDDKVKININKTINYENVDRLLNEQREKSIKFLKNALEI